MHLTRVLALCVAALVGLIAGIAGSLLCGETVAYASPEMAMAAPVQATRVVYVEPGFPVSIATEPPDVPTRSSSRSAASSLRYRSPEWRSALSAFSSITSSRAT